MADPNGFAMNSGELKATARYFDQIQRASDRLGRTRYQNIIKLNNELKFTARHFDQIYRTALKLSRLKLMPRVTLDDKASGEIDRLIAKLGQIRSKRVQVAADVKMPVVPVAPKVQQSVAAVPPIAKGTQVLPKVPERVETLPPVATGGSTIGKMKPIAPKPTPAVETPTVTQQQQQSLTLSITNPATTSVPPIDFQPLVTALIINTDAVVQLTSKLGALQFSVGSGGNGEKEKPEVTSIITDLLDTGKSIADMRVDSQTIKMKKDELKKLDEDRLNHFLNSSDPVYREAEKKYQDESKLLKREITASRASAVANAWGGGLGLYNGAKDIWDVFTGDSEERAQTSATETASMLIQQTSNSGLLDNVAKGAVGRVLGPVSTALQVGDAIRMTDDKERFELLGGAAGGAIGTSAGAAIGTAILPGIGTAVGGYLGGMAGDFVGGKVGGLVYEYGGEVTKAIDGTLDKLSEKMNDFFNWGKDKDKEKEKTETKPAAPLSPTLANAVGAPSPAMYGPMINPAPPRFADPLDPIGMMNQRLISQAAPKPVIPTSPATQPSSQINVEMSQTQMSAVSGMIQDAKAEVTNQISINISPGTVQLDIHEEIDYAEIEGKIGASIVAKVRQAFQNYKPSGGGGGSAGPAQSMAT